MLALGDQIPGTDVFKFITFRTVGAIMTALIFVFLFGPRLISTLRLKQGKGQPIREDGPQSHIIEKQGTPTMGGLMILSGIIVSTLLWADLENRLIWVAVDLGLLNLEQPTIMTWVLLFVLATILAVGISWSHVRRRVTGQADIDDVDE